MLSFLISFLLFSNIPTYFPDEMMFRNIHIDGNKGSYIVTGEAKMKNRVIFYSVEDGHVEFIHDKRLLVKKSPNWEKFKIMINIPSTNLPQNGSLILNLYERTNKGEIIHSFPFILEKFGNKRADAKNRVSSFGNH